MKLKRTILLILLSLRIMLVLFAETKETPVTILEQNVEFYYDGNNLQKYTFIQKYKINNQKGAESWNYTTGSWRPWYQDKPELTATVTNPSGETYVLDQSTLVEVGTKESNKIYSDSKKLKAPLPSIQVGSIVEEKLVKVMKPFFSAGYDTSIYTQSGNPINKITLKINVPVDLEVTFKDFIVEYTPEIVTNNNRKIYTIILENLEALDDHPLLTGGEYRHWPEIYWTTAKNWNSVAKEYKNLITPQLKSDSKADDFLKEVDLNGSKDEILTRILMHLHNEIRYTGLELGDSSIIPHTPNETIERKYGDCKDKAVLLYTLLKKVGIKSNIALLQAGYGTDVPKDIPGIRQFNHAIVYLPKPFDIWIDATAEFSRLGELPITSSNRYALIIDENTKELVKTPTVVSSDNTRTLTHEVFMSQLGESKVIERLDVTGVFGSHERDYFYYLSEKEINENINNYVKESFNSNDVENFNKLDSKDLTTDFYYEFTVPKSNLGYTGSNTSDISLNLRDVIQMFPRQLKNLEHYEYNGGEKEDSEWFERKQELILDYPFISNHNFIIHFPEGFVISELPKNEEFIIGSTKYSRKFSQENNSVYVNISVDTGNGNYNPSQLNELRDFFYKLYNEKSQKITANSFKNVYINNDEFQACVNYYLSKIDSEPEELSHYVRLASAYSEAGFVDTANKYLKFALSLDPKNIEAKMAYAYSFLYDELGRSEYKKDNIQSSMKEYLEVTTIDPEIKFSWRNLAVLSEYGDSGFRYNSGADLEAALKYYDLYRENIKSDDLNFNILIDLLKLKQFDRLLEHIDMIKKLNTYEAWSIYFTAISIKEGPEVVYKQISALTSTPDNRNRLIEETSTNVQQLREYKLAADLLSYVDKSTDKYIEIENKIKFLNSLSHYEDEKIDISKPESAVQRFWFKAFLEGEVTPEEISELFSQKLIDFVGIDSLLDELDDAKKEVVSNSLKSNIDMDVMRDMLLTSVNYNVEQAGDLYRVITTVNFPTQQVSELFFVRKEEGSFKLINNDNPWLASESILNLLENNNKVAAIKILNWIKEGSDRGEYQSQISNVWKSNKRTDEWIKMGVASLVYSFKNNQNFLIELKDSFLKNGMGEIYTWMLATNYRENKQYKEAYELVSKHILQDGLSTEFSRDYFQIYHENQKYDEFYKILMDSIKFEPTNVILHDLVVDNYAIQGKYQESFEYLKSYVENIGDNAYMYNNLAWHGQFAGHGLDELLSYSSASNQMTKFENSAFLDTLAVLLAEAGKVKQSREILLHLMGDSDIKKLDGEFYIMGLNAITLGLIDEAKYFLSKVKKPETESGVSTYLLAQDKLTTLK